MKITAILGSPRKKGVTNRIAGEFMGVAGENGAEVTVYTLNDMDFRGCQGCGTCKDKLDHCILKDDLAPALAGLREADIIVFASPVYYWDVTGQFKCFFDRTWSLVKPDYQTNPEPVRLAPGKKAVWISSQGDVADKHKDIIEKYTGFLAMYGSETHVIRAFGMMGDTGGNLDACLEQAGELAATLTG